MGKKGKHLNKTEKMQTSEHNNFESDKRKINDKNELIDDCNLESTQVSASNTMNLYNPLKQFMHDKINERFIEGLKMCHTMAKLVESQQTNQLDIMLNVESIFTLSSKSNVAKTAAANTTAGSTEAITPATAFAHSQNASAEKKLESTDKYTRNFRLKRKHKDLEISMDEDSKFNSPMSVGSMFSFGNVTNDGVGIHHKLSDINETGSSQECKKSIGSDSSRPRILGSSSKPNPGFQPTTATSSTTTGATTNEFAKSQEVRTGPVNIQALRKKGPLSAEPIIYSKKGGTSSFSPAAAAAATHSPKFASTQVLSMPGKIFQSESKRQANYSKDSVPKLNKPITAPWNTSQGQTRPLSSTRSIHGTNERMGIISSRMGPISSSKLGGGIVSSSGVNASSVASTGGAQRTKPVGKQTTPIGTARPKEDSVLNDAQRTTLKTNKISPFYKTHTAKVPPTKQEVVLRHEPEDSFEFDSSFIASWANGEMTGSNFVVPSSPVNVNCLLPVHTDSIFSKEDRCFNRSKYS